MGPLEDWDLPSFNGLQWVFYKSHFDQDLLMFLVVHLNVVPWTILEPCRHRSPDFDQNHKPKKASFLELVKHYFRGRQQACLNSIETVKVYQDFDLGYTLHITWP